MTAGTWPPALWNPPATPALRACPIVLPHYCPHSSQCSAAAGIGACAGAALRAVREGGSRTILHGRRCSYSAFALAMRVGRDGNGDATQPGVQHQPAGPAGRDGAGRRLPHQAGAGRRRLRHHLPRRRDRARPPRHHQGILSGRLRRPRATPAMPRRARRTAPSDYKWGLDRFIEEAQTLARFVHPNIVRVYRYFRANNTGYMVLHFEEGGSFKAWLKGLEARAAPARARQDPRAAARRARAGARGRLPAPRHRPRQHHHPQGRLAGADRLRLGARRDRLAFQDRQRAGQAGLQPLRAVRHHQPPAGAVDRHLRARRHALSRHHRQAPARCALAHGQRRVRARPAKRRSAPTAPAFLAAIDKALQARGRRAAAIDRANGASSCWRRSPSASGPARSAAARSQRLRTARSEPAPPPPEPEQEARSRCSPTRPPSLVPRAPRCAAAEGPAARLHRGA